MSPLQAVTRQVARALVRHAALVSPGERAEWAQAMINELDYLSPDTSTVGWALGCIWVCYSERIRAMVRSLASLPRWVLVLEMLVCFLPLTLLFSAVVQRELDGGFTPQSALLYGSATILGPLGLAAAFRSLFEIRRDESRSDRRALPARCLDARRLFGANSDFWPKSFVRLVAGVRVDRGLAPSRCASPGLHRFPQARFAASRVRS